MSRSAESKNGAGANLPESTSVTFLEKVQAQQPEAWRRLVRLYGPVLYVWCRQSGLQPEDAADVVQEVFMAVATHVMGFRHDRPGATFRGWLWVIARNKIRDHFRRRAGRARAPGGTAAQEELAQLPDQLSDASSSGADPPCADGLEHRALELIQGEFEDRTWQVFLRATIEGHSAAQIAADTGMTTRAVRQAKYRVLRRLRRELDQVVD
jgi:RNA polymerase sigma-70 factor (ECF subfamily)